MITLENKAWMAGFFDGEGNVGITPRRKEGDICRAGFGIKIGLSNTWDEPLLIFVKHFGGHLCYQARENEPWHKPYYKWRCPSHNAERFLRLLLPYLTVKRVRAKLALEFLKTGRGSGCRYSIGESRLRIDMFDRMKALNLRGRKDFTPEAKYSIMGVK